jgi:hypothetical protein
VWLGACLVRLDRASEGRALLTSGYERLRHEPHFRADALEASRQLAALAKPGG